MITQARDLSTALPGDVSPSCAMAFDFAESSTAPADSDTCSLRPASELTDSTDVQMLAAEQLEGLGDDRRKRKRSFESAMSGLDPTAKSRLHDACAALLNRQLQQGDIVYEVQEASCGTSSSSSANSCVARLRLPNLPGSIGDQTWSGGPCSSRREARLQAAVAALKTISPEACVTLAGEDVAEIGNEPADVVASHRPGEISGSDLNAKSELSVFLQWKTGKTLDKGDISYRTCRREGRYYTTIRLDYLNKLEFIGDAANDAKAAQNAAARLVLEHFAKEVAKWAKEMQSKKIFASKKKRKVAQSKDAAMVTNPSSVDMKAQCKLHEALRTVLGRDLSPGDVVYDVVGNNEEFACTLKLPCLPSIPGHEASGQQIWSASKPCTSKRDARASVAQLALDSIQERIRAHSD